MKVPIPPPFINNRKIDLTSSVIFTDDKPILELVHLVASEKWRNSLEKLEAKGQR